MGKRFEFFKLEFPQLILYGNVWISVWRICMWILVHEGLRKLLVGEVSQIRLKCYLRRIYHQHALCAMYISGADPGNFVANYFSHRDNHLFSICERQLPSLAREIPTAMRAEVIIGGYPKIITIFNIPGI